MIPKYKVNDIVYYNVQYSNYPKCDKCNQYLYTAEEKTEDVIESCVITDIYINISEKGTIIKYQTTSQFRTFEESALFSSEEEALVSKEIIE